MVDMVDTPSDGRRERLIAEFERSLDLLDPGGDRLAEVVDIDRAARRAAEGVVGSSAAWAETVGPFYSTDGVRHLLGGDDGPVSRQAVTKRKGLLVLRSGNGRLAYPTFQFDGDQPVLGLAEVLAVLDERLVSRWTVASWLVTEHDELGGGRPIDLLFERRTDEVLAVARRWAAALAA